MFSVVLWLMAMAAVLTAPYALGSADVGDDLIRNTVRVSLAFWFAAAYAMLASSAGRDAHPTAAARASASALVGRASLPACVAARRCWTLAWAAYIVHLYMAFEHYHGWSHGHAVEHVQAVSGFGPGIWVSHTFTLLWTLDVGYWWINPAAYAARSPWIGRPLHGFMVFIIFNATVVYEAGPIRWAGAAMLLVLGAVWLRARRLHTAVALSGGGVLSG